MEQYEVTSQAGLTTLRAIDWGVEKVKLFGKDSLFTWGHVAFSEVELQESFERALTDSSCEPRVCVLEIVER